MSIIFFLLKVQVRNFTNDLAEEKFIVIQCFALVFPITLKKRID